MPDNTPDPKGDALIAAVAAMQAVDAAYYALSSPALSRDEFLYEALSTGAAHAMYIREVPVEQRRLEFELGGLIFTSEEQPND